MCCAYHMCIFISSINIGFNLPPHDGQIKPVLICSRIRSHISNVGRYLPNIVQQSSLDWKELSPPVDCWMMYYDLATCCRRSPSKSNCLCWLSIYNRPCIIAIAIPSINRVFSSDDIHHVCNRINFIYCSRSAYNYDMYLVESFFLLWSEQQ